MSKNFQLQLIKKSLDDLGYSAVANALVQQMNEQAGSASPPSLLDLIFRGEYTSLLSLFLGSLDEFHFSNSLHSEIASLTPQQVCLATYLVLRSSYLEDMLLLALGQPVSVSAEQIFRNLQRLTNESLARLDLTNLPPSLLQCLTREDEYSALLPLVMNPPSRDNLEAMFFTPQVLLTKVKLSPHATHDDQFYIHKLRGALVSVLRNAVGVPKPASQIAATLAYPDIPDNFLLDIILNAARYTLSKSLYYLPPRDRPMSDSELVLRATEMQSATRDDLPITLLHTLSDHKDEVWFTKFSPSGKYLATGSLDGTCIIYDVMDKFKVLAELSSTAAEESKVFVESSHKPALDKSKGIIYLSWEPHERYIVTCCLDTVVRVWNIECVTGSKRVTRSMHAAEHATLLCCFNLGERMRTWPCEFLNYSKEVTPHFIVGSPDKVLKAFSINGYEVLDFYSDADEWSTILGEVPNPAPGSPMSLVTSHQAPPKLEPSTTAEPDSQSTNGNAQASQFNRINDFAITPNGKILITANNDKQVYFYRIPNLFDPATTTSRIAILTLNGRLTSCNVSADGKLLLLSVAPEELQVWDISPLDNLEKPFLKQKFLGQSQAIYMLRSCFGYVTSSNMREQLVLSGSDDGYIYMWRLETGQLITRVKGHEGLCNSVDWNRFYPAKAGVDYGKYWCSVGDDKLVKIWGPNT